MNKQAHDLAAIVRDWCKRHYSAIPDALRNELQHEVQRYVLKLDVETLTTEAKREGQ